jgi:hypothetical protein
MQRFLSKSCILSGLFVLSLLGCAESKNMTTSPDASTENEISSHYKTLSLSQTGNSFFVSPQGKASGTGTLENPWDLQTALNHPAAVKPGYTIWLRGGVYNGLFVGKLRGTSGAPITVRNYNGERATLAYANAIATDAILTSATANSYTNYWGLEIVNTNLTRQFNVSGSHGRATGFTVFGANNKFINMVVHDAGNGTGFWSATNNISSELYGNLFYNNGWQGTDRGHGHSIYVQNNSGVKRIVDNEWTLSKHAL